MTIDIALAFTAPKKVEGGCILLSVSGSTKSYDDLRRSILGASCKIHQPHITILHPRNVTEQKLALADLAKIAFPTKVHFKEISVIEQVNGGIWNIVDRYTGYRQGVFGVDLHGQTLNS